MARPTVQQLRTAQAALDDAAKVLEDRGDAATAARIDRFVATAARGVLAADLPEPEADEPAAPPLNLPTPPAPHMAISDMAATVEQIVRSGVEALRSQMNDLSVPMADLSADVESDKMEGRRLAIAKDVISTYTSTAALIDQMQQQMQQQLLAKLRLLAEEMGAAASAPTEPTVAASRRVRAAVVSTKALDLYEQIGTTLEITPNETSKGFTKDANFTKVINDLVPAFVAALKADLSESPASKRAGAESVASRRVRASDDAPVPDIASQVQLLEAVAQPLSDAEDALMLAKQAEKAADESEGAAGDILYSIQRSVGGMGREKISCEFLWKATRDMLKRLDKEQMRLENLRLKQAGSVESSRRMRAAADRVWTQPANQRDCRVCGEPATTEYQCTKETERAADEGRWTPLCGEHGKDARKHCGGGSVVANRRVRANESIDEDIDIFCDPDGHLPERRECAADICAWIRAGRPLPAGAKERIEKTATGSGFSTMRAHAKIMLKLLDSEEVTASRRVRAAAPNETLTVDYTAESGQIYRYCEDDDEAKQLEDDMSCIPTGSVERAGDFVYWTADSTYAEFMGEEDTRSDDEKNQQADAEIEEVRRAVEALEKAGFKVEEV